MSERELELLSRRLMLAQSMNGRVALRLLALLRELLWSLFTRGPAIGKRALDIVVSLIALLLLSPLFLLIFLLIKLEDSGPIFFIQTRVGQFGREFKMLKFRSMCLDAEQRLKDLLAQNQHKDGV